MPKQNKLRLSTGKQFIALVVCQIAFERSVLAIVPQLRKKATNSELIEDLDGMSGGCSDNIADLTGIYGKTPAVAGKANPKLAKSAPMDATGKALLGELKGAMKIGDQTARDIAIQTALGKANSYQQEAYQQIVALSETLGHPADTTDTLDTMKGNASEAGADMDDNDAALMESFRQAIAAQDPERVAAE